MLDRLPLEDILILDLTWVIAGPNATHLFQELGAKIIKVESKYSLDVVRTGGQRKNNKDPRKFGGWAFNELNHDKLDIALNLKSEKGREALEELVKMSDVVVANYGTSAFRKLRLTFDDLNQIKPDIIVLNASGLGAWGPCANYISFAPVVQALSGIASLVGYESGNTLYDGYPALADYLGSMAVATNLMAAIAYREKTGKGQFIDLSQVESASTFMGTALLDHQINATPHRFIGNHHYSGAAAPHNAYRCSGGERWCTIAVSSDDEWERFCQVVDPEGSWSSDSRFQTLSGRLEHQAELDALVEAWTIERSPMDVAEALQSNMVSAAPVQTASEALFHDEHLRDREFFRMVTFPPSEAYPDKFIVNGPQIRFPGMEIKKDLAPAPSVGQDTDFVLKHYLHKSEEWISCARSEGALE